MQITIKELKKMISEAVNECYHDMEAHHDMKDHDGMKDLFDTLSAQKGKRHDHKMSRHNPEEEKIVLVLPMQEKKQKWMQAAVKKKGALSKQLGVPEEKNLSMAELEKKKAALQKKGAGDKKLSAHDLKLLQRINFAITAKKTAAKKKKKTVKEAIAGVEEKLKPAQVSLHRKVSPKEAPRQSAVAESFKNQIRKMVKEILSNSK